MCWVGLERKHSVLGKVRERREKDLPESRIYIMLFSPSPQRRISQNSDIGCSLPEKTKGLLEARIPDLGCPMFSPREGSPRILDFARISARTMVYPGIATWASRWKSFSQDSVIPIKDTFTPFSLRLISSLHIHTPHFVAVCSWIKSTGI